MITLTEEELRQIKNEAFERGLHKKIALMTSLNLDDDFNSSSDQAKLQKLVDWYEACKKAYYAEADES